MTHVHNAPRKAVSLESLGARLRADMSELTSLRAALDCAVPQYQGDALQQLGYLIALAQPERRAPATADTVRPPPEPKPARGHDREPVCDCTSCGNYSLPRDDYPCTACGYTYSKWTKP